MSCRQKKHICNYAQVCDDMKVITGLYVNLEAWCNGATPLIFTAEKSAFGIQRQTGEELLGDSSLFLFSLHATCRTARQVIALEETSSRNIQITHTIIQSNLMLHGFFRVR